jgi:hypothetical protein
MISKVETENLNPFWFQPFSFFAQKLDSVRVLVLKTTMRSPLLKKVFVTRALRLSLFFALSLIANFMFAAKFPLWSLLIGPIVLGVPHLLSSIRYVPQMNSQTATENSKKLYTTVGSLFVFMAVARLGLTHFNVQLLNQFPNLLEVFVGTLSLGVVIAIQRTWDKVLPALGILIPLFGATLLYPLQTVGALVLLHNAVGFFFWIKAARSKLDRLVAIGSLLIFIAVNALLFLGIFDFLFMTRSTGILNGALNSLSIGSMIFPNGSFVLWERAVTAYAFGQGIHYFVWLKAIPEQNLNYEHPVSFVQSLRYLEKDFNKIALWTVLLASITLLAYAVVASFPAARYLYLSGSAFHGYFEIMGLALLFGNSTQAKGIQVGI